MSISVLIYGKKENTNKRQSDSYLIQGNDKRYSLRNNSKPVRRLLQIV